VGGGAGGAGGATTRAPAGPDDDVHRPKESTTVMQWSTMMGRQIRHLRQIRVPSLALTVLTVLTVLATGVGAAAAHPAVGHAHQYRTINMRAQVVGSTSITIRWDAMPLQLPLPYHWLETNASPGLSWQGRWLEIFEANALQLHFTGLQPGRSYSFVIRDCPQRDPTTCVTSATLDVLTRPAPPTLHAGTVTTTSVTVLWTDVSPSVTQLRLRSNATASGEWRSVTHPDSVRSATFNNLDPDSAYSFVIQACNATGCSGDSATLTVLTPPLGTPPAAPTNLRVYRCGPLEPCAVGGVTLLWDDNATNETGFEFQWGQPLAGCQPGVGQDCVAWSNPVVRPANAEQYRVNNLTVGQLYFFRVRACNPAGCSSYSNRVSETVQ
jgi:hypothetical protein